MDKSLVCHGKRLKFGVKRMFATKFVIENSNDKRVRIKLNLMANGNKLSPKYFGVTENLVANMVVNVCHLILLTNLVAKF